jgi:hypothetical protein
MNYRFQKITTIYPEFERQFLAENEDYTDLSYDDLFDRFAKTLYGWSDFFTTHMLEIGNEAQDIFASLEPLQKAWAREHGAVYQEETWLRDIALAQVRAFQPDVLFLQDLYLFDQPLRAALRSVCVKPILLVGWRAAPTTDFHEFKDLDLILTAFPHFVERLRAVGANAYLMLHAFEQSVLQAIPSNTDRIHRFTFAGSLGGGTGSFSSRYAMVEQLIATTPLEVWGNTGYPIRGLKHWLLLKSIHTSNQLLSSFGVSSNRRSAIPLVRNGVDWTGDPTRPSLESKYSRRFHPPVFGTAYYGLLAQSKLTLNFHINAAEAAASNVRMYEATGMGACLVTDWKPNLDDIFDPDHEVVSYRTPEEASEKVAYLLDHDSERNAIATAGQRRTLQDHTLKQRVMELDEMLKSMLPCRVTLRSNSWKSPTNDWRR